MLKISLSVILLFSLSGCISTSIISDTTKVSRDELKNIPKGAKFIEVIKSISADSLYENIYEILISKGHRIFKDDKKRYYLTTEGKDIGQSTLQRMVLKITENGDTSKLKISTEWKAGSEATNFASALGGMTAQSDWAIATWETNRLGIAFAESYSIAKEVKDAEILFSK